MLIEIKDLPKNPDDALEKVVEAIIDVLPRDNSKFGALSQTSPKVFNDVTVCLIAARQIARRISDNDAKEHALKSFEGVNIQSCIALRNALMSVLDALFASNIGKHFLDHEMKEELDQAVLTQNEKQEIRSLMAEARQLINDASYMSSKHKRNVLYQISKVEDELYKEKTGFAAFLSAGYEAGNLLETYGEKAKPLAKVIQMARTTTARKIVGYQQIEADEKPKLLTKEDDNV